ncbi:hypothetical protein PR048_003334 [Dryococelus australis]|uniref:Uncharacterized protein n=1 Tax=Dryococelus australis TaxID=614101 RepID=A0ABQ9IMT7_9NEOP|nr:hypothetical protein PR048_003334 [Dryococelus australis]
MQKTPTPLCLNREELNMSSCLSKFRSYMGPYNIHRINENGVKVKNVEIRDGHDIRWHKWFSVDSSEDVHINHDVDIIQAATRCRRNPAVVLSHVDSVKCSSETDPCFKAPLPHVSSVKHEDVFSECEGVLENIVMEVEKLHGNPGLPPNPKDIKLEQHDSHLTDDVLLDCYHVLQEIVDKVSLGCELSVCSLLSGVKCVRFVDRTAGRPTTFYADLWQKLCSGSWPQNNVTVILPVKCGDQAPVTPNMQHSPVVRCVSPQMSGNIRARKRKRQTLIRKPPRKVNTRAMREYPQASRRLRSSTPNSRARGHRRRAVAKRSFYDYQYVYSDDEVLGDDSVWDKVPPKLKTRSTNPIVDVKKLTFQLKYPPCVVLEALSSDALRGHLANDT